LSPQYLFENLEQNNLPLSFGKFLIYLALTIKRLFENFRNENSRFYCPVSVLLRVSFRFGLVSCLNLPNLVVNRRLEATMKGRCLCRCNNAWAWTGLQTALCAVGNRFETSITSAARLRSVDVPVTTDQSCPISRLGRLPVR
jgi:hypothetical protein